MVYESYKSKEKKSSKGFIHFLIVILIIGQALDAGYYLYSHLFPIKHLLRIDLLFFVIKNGLFASIIIYMYRHGQRTLGQFSRRKVAFYITSIFIVIAWFNGSILGFFFWDGPYWGRVVDADTHEPIVGANVMGYWDFNLFLFFVEQSLYADARETVTNENGVFYLPTARAFLAWPLSRLEFGYSEHLNVYSSGYDSYPPRMQYAWKKMGESKWRVKLAQTYSDVDETYSIKDIYRIAFTVPHQEIKPNNQIIIKLNKADSLNEQSEAALISVCDIPNSDKFKIENISNMRDKELSRINDERSK